MQNSYALIAGASRGLGKSFAFELAKRGFNLLLVSLPDEGIELICHDIKEKYKVDAQCFETDLTVFENVVKVSTWADSNFEIQILINNAGVGGTKKILDADLSYINAILQLNVVSTSILTRALLPNLLRQSAAYILNISSLAALNPIGYKTVYPASKTYIDAFSLSLGLELSDTNVQVSTANLGPMCTNDEVTNRIKKQGFLMKFVVVEPEIVAIKCLNQLFKKKNVIQINKLGCFILKLIPRWIRLPLMTRKIKSEIFSSK